MLLLTAIGVLLFRESLNYFEVIGIVLAVTSLVLLMRFAEACLDSVAFDFHKQVFDVEWRMNSKQIAVILKSFDAPDEVRVMQKGKFELVQIGGMAIGRATYEPGWKWSEHVGPSIGATRCPVEHVGLVLSGTATVAFNDGRVIELHAGDLFYVPPVRHDSWVIGDEPYVSLHFLGADRYATESR